VVFQNLVRRSSSEPFLLSKRELKEDFLVISGCTWIGIWACRFGTLVSLSRVWKDGGWTARLDGGPVCDEDGRGEAGDLAVFVTVAPLEVPVERFEGLLECRCR